MIAIGVFALAICTWQLVKYAIIKKKVQNAITEKTQGLYVIQYESLSLDETSGTLLVKNIGISPDSAVYARMVKDGSAPSTLIRAAIPSLQVFGVKTPKALLTRQVEGRKIEIVNPAIEIILGAGSSQADTSDADLEKDISRAVLASLLKIRVDSINIVHGNLSVRKIQQRDPLLKLDDLTCLLSDLLIDSIAVKDSSRIFFSRNLKMSCVTLEMSSKNKNYHLYMDGVHYTSHGDSLSIDRLRWKPRLSETAFAASFPVATDRYDFSLEDIRLLHIGRAGLWHDRIAADSLLVGRSSFKIYCDVSYPSDTKSQTGNYPQELLLKLPFTVNIHRTIFKHTFIEYKEKNAKSDSAGKLQFFDGTATVDNLTNDRKAIAVNKKCTLLFRSKFLNHAPVNIRLLLFLGDPGGRFFAEGRLGPIDAPLINPLTEPMGLVRVGKGFIDSLYFTLSGNNTTSDGRLTLLYKGVNIFFLRKDSHQPKFHRKILPSVMTNIVMKHSNPWIFGAPKTVDIHQRRKASSSFLSFVWKSIFSGIKRTAEIK